MKPILIATIFLYSAAVACADDGGKIPWVNAKDKKSEKGVADAMAAAKKAGKPMMLYFTSDG